MEKGRVHIYTGDGKGKTTAAIGLCTRAAGAGLRVVFCQFLKNGRSGEIESLKKLGVQVEVAVCQKFLWDMSEGEKTQCLKAQAETLAKAAGLAEEADLLVLDEVISVVGGGLLPKDGLLALVKEKPEGLELVLTGRGDCAYLLPVADYVTEMRMVAHPYETEGLSARRGIEF